MLQKESNAAFHPNCRIQRRPNWNGDLNLLANTYKPPFFGRLQEPTPVLLHDWLIGLKTTKGNPKVSSKAGATNARAAARSETPNFRSGGPLLDEALVGRCIRGDCSCTSHVGYMSSCRNYRCEHSYQDHVVSSQSINSRSISMVFSSSSSSSSSSSI